jgi:hypothetical protein
MTQVATSARAAKKTTAPKAAPPAEVEEEDDDEPTIELEYTDIDADGKPVQTTLMAYEPADGQIAALFATNASFSSMPERVAGMINFLVNILPEEEHSRIVSRLFSRKDKFGTEQVMALVNQYVEKVTGRPTERPGGSA